MEFTKYGLFQMPRGYEPVKAHRTEAREFPYGSFYIPVIKLWMRLSGTTVKVVGSENIPLENGALIASNHTNYLDMFWVGIPAHLRGRRLVRFMAKKEIFDAKYVGFFMRSMKHLPVDRAAGTASVTEAVERLNKGDLLGIFPEATVSRSFELKEFKTGAVRIAAAADVPLIPMATWGAHRIWTKGGKPNLGRKKIPVRIHVGKPFDPHGDPEERTAELHKVMAGLLDDARSAYEQDFGPFPGGEDWRPASLGGGAPTLEEAAVLAEQEKARKAAKKDAKK